MDFEENTSLDYNQVHEGKIKYIITYKNKINGAMGIITGDAVSKSEIEKNFNQKFSNYEIVKTHDLYEWLEDVGEEFAKDLLKHLKTIDDFIDSPKTIDSIINPQKTNKIDYKSKSFLKGLKKINGEAERSEKMSTPNSEGMNTSFNV